MPAPWEKYAAESPAPGPWAKYALSQPEEPSFLETTVNQVPGAASMGEIQQGKNPYSLEPEGQARALGDIGGLAGAGALVGATGGAAIPVVGAGALAGAALEKSGIGPYARNMGERIMQADKVAPFAESPNPIVKAAQYAKSLAGQVPAAAESASWEAAPSILAQLAAGAGNMLKPNAPKPIAPGAQALMDAGAEVTPAMRGSSIGKIAETSARLDPLTVGKMGRVDQSVHDATRAIAQKNFGSDILEGNAPKQGAKLQSALEDMATERADKYAPVLGKLTGKPSQGIAKNMIDSVVALKADETLSPKAIDAFAGAMAEEMKGTKTALGIDKALTRIKDAYKSKLAPGENGLSGQQTHDFNTMMNAAKDTYYSSLGKVGDELRAAKGDYAEATQGMEPISEALQARQDDPGRIGVNLASKPAALKAALDSASPKTAQAIREGVAHSIVREAMTADGISSATLKSLIGKRFKDTMKYLGPEAEKLRSLSDAMEAGKVATLAKTNPSGTGMANSIAATGTMGAGAAVEALHGNPGPLAALGIRGLGDLAYAHAGIPIDNALRTAQTGLSKIPTAPSPLINSLQRAKGLAQSFGAK